MSPTPADPANPAATPSGWLDRVAHAASRLADWLVAHRRGALIALIGTQICLTAALFLSIDHNGWLTYQGGDQIWLYTTGWLLGENQLAYTLVGYAWPMMLAPIAALAGPSFVAALPGTIALCVLVLGPIATLAVYDIATRIAGALAGLWCAALWVAAPFVAIPLFVDRYHERYVEQFLPQALGLTQLADFPSMVAVLVSAAYVVRSLRADRGREALLAGLLAGFAIGLKPANALFLVGPGLAYLLARQWRSGALFAVALTPAVLTLAVWKLRGTGELPVLETSSIRVAAGSAIPLAESFYERYVPLDWGELQRNMAELREFFWSARLVQWAPFAGLLAVLRLSRPAAGLLMGWLLAYVLVKGSSPVASIESGSSFFRLVMPAFPAYLLLIAAIPLLVPTVLRRLRARLQVSVDHPLGRRPLVIAVCFLALLPLVLVMLPTPLTGSALAVEQNGILTPVDSSRVPVTAEREDEAVRLTWERDAGRSTVFYVVYRTRSTEPDVVCLQVTRYLQPRDRGAERCRLDMIELARTRETTFVDASPEPGVTYRVGVAANHEDDPEEGDVFLLSEPVKAP